MLRNCKITGEFLVHRTGHEIRSLFRLNFGDSFWCSGLKLRSTKPHSQSVGINFKANKFAVTVYKCFITFKNIRHPTTILLLKRLTLQFISTNVFTKFPLQTAKEDFME